MTPDGEEEIKERELEEEQEHGEEEEEEEEEDEGCEGEEAAPSHLPFAPTTSAASELLEISTTVDPSYIISLIRKLLPHDVRIKSCSKSIHKDDDSVQEAEKYHAEPSKHAEKNGRSDGVSKQPQLSEAEDPWEECGCILWDLAANKTHAKFMVDNLLLEVLSASLTVSKSARVTEICLGIIGNLACHDVLSNAIISENGLVERIVDQLFLDDTACLSETCRLLAVCLQGRESAWWAKALHSDHILQHIMWITENTLNLQLLEKGMELLSAIIDSEVAAPILLPSLTKMGLPNLLVDLLASEISKITHENKLERSSVLDLILRSIEALSTKNTYSQLISSNERLFQLLSGMVKLPDKVEVSSCCATIVVTIANILTDELHLVSNISQDLPFLQGLFDIFPFVSDDLDARNALWSILARSLQQVQENNNMSMSALQQFSSVLLDKAHLIEDDLDSHTTQDSGEVVERTCAYSEKLDAKDASLRSIASILNQWITRRPASLVEENQNIDANDDRKVQRLLNYCCKYSSVVDNDA